MISIFIPSNEVNNMQNWAQNIIMQCFDKKESFGDSTIFNFFDDSYKIGNSELVQKFWKVKEQQEEFSNDILKINDFPIDRLKELVGEEYETGDFICYFEFSLAEIFYKYLKSQQGIIMHISHDDEMYDDDE